MFSHLDTYTRPNVDRCALITIDLQNDFVLPGAPAEGAGALGVAHRTAHLTDWFRNRHLPVFHVIRLYSLAHGPENIDVCRRLAVEQGLSLVAPGTEGARLAKGMVPGDFEMDPDLLLAGGKQAIGPREWMLYKPRWGCFHGTRLEEMLHELNVDTLVISGTWFANCVRTTIYEATARDFRVIALSDAIAGFHDHGAEDLKKVKCGVCSCEEWRNFAEEEL